MAEPTYASPIGAFLGGLQKSRNRQQQEAANQLTEQLRQAQILSAQQAASEAPIRQALLEQQLRRALMTPEQLAIEDARAANIKTLASQPGVIFQSGGAVEEITPEAQQIINLRQTAEEQGGVPFTREGISGIQMQTPVPGLPGAVRSPAEISRLQDQARINAALKRELAGPSFERVGDSLVRINPDYTVSPAFTTPPKVQTKEVFLRNKITGEVTPTQLPFGQPVPKEFDVVSESNLVPKPSEVKLLPDEKKIVETLATKNATKISIANQIDQTSSILEDPKIDNTTKIKEGQRLLKVLNSSEGADAVGVEESKRLGSLIEYQILNLRGMIDPTQQVFGVNLAGYRDQIKTASDAIKGSVKANEDVINSIYSKYGIPTSTPTSSDSSTAPIQIKSIRRKQ